MRKIVLGAMKANLFVMTALIDQFGVAAATTMYTANSTAGVVNQAFAQQVNTHQNIEHT